MSFCTCNLNIKFMSSIDSIIEKQKRKQQLWLLQSKQEKENMDDDPTDVPPEEYSCPICYEMYNNEERKPLVLFPCGHSVCESCKKKSEEINYGKPNKCCYCNQKYTSSTVNYALLSVLALQSSPQANKPKFDYKNELQIAIQRYGILTSQLRESQEKAKKLKSDMKSEEILVNHIFNELTYIQEQYTIHKDKLHELKEQEKNMDKDIKSLQDIIGPLTTEIEKLRLLAQGEENDE